MSVSIYLSLLAFLMAPIVIAHGKESGVKTSKLSRIVRKANENHLRQLFEKKNLKWGGPLYVRVFKHTRELEIWAHNQAGEFELFKTFRICYHSGQVGPKTRQGDMQVPEGFYQVNVGRLNPYSSYHLSFNIGYPNKLDRSLNRTGGNIMVHGDCVSAGCLAMTNPGVEKIYTIVEASLIGGVTEIPIHIFPFRMNYLNRLRFVRFPHWEFWNQLMPAYQYFEKYKEVPRVEVKGKLYRLVQDK
ncbi:MAG: L,D-transpeptidase family protein [Bdellovibrionales bacterium]|nr:L,D-transpeptidase family protein [Bdellovibrionales bacterium]